MRLSVLLFLLIGSLSSPVTAAPLCQAIFQAPAQKQTQKIDVDKTTVTWYGPIAIDTADLQYLAERFEIKWAPGATRDARTYFSTISLNRETNKSTVLLEPIQETARLTALTDSRLELTWDTYLRMSVVTPAEINEFKQTEAELAPQRKVNFETSTSDGRTLAIMRLYDGSPYPFSYLGEKPRYFEKVSGDPRMPIERRYPHLSRSLRSESDYVFELGRLAKVDEFPDGLDYQLYNAGSYFMGKFGFLGVAMPEYIEKGRVCIEITGKHLKHYMRPREKGGMGFHLFAAAMNKQPMNEVKPGATFESLGLKRDDHEAKFVLYLTVAEFISNFYQKVELRPAEEVYPDRF